MQHAKKLEEVNETLITWKEGMIVIQRQEVLAWNEAKQWCEGTNT